MYGNKNWNLNKPKLILSIKGDAANLKVSQKMKKIFKQGLIKTAITANAWISIVFFILI